MIVIDVPGGKDVDGFVAQAMPIVRSFTFDK